MAVKTTIILCVVMMVVGALLGGWGMHELDSRAKVKAVETATGEMSAERDALARTGKMMELRFRIGKAAIEANKLNYGNARTEATELFAQAEKLQGTVAGTADERELQMILSRKEQILGDLAVGNPAAGAGLEQMYTASTKGAGTR